MKTTLNKILEHDPCASGWKKLLRSLNKTKADDKPLSIITILESNGLDDAIWCLRAVDGHDKEIKLFAIRCARRVQHLMRDPRSTAALDVAERFANGQATTKEELDAMWDAASAAVRDAASDAASAAALAAALAAASDAASDATRAAASAAASDAASAAASDAASAAASDATRAAVWAAERKHQENDLRKMCEVFA